ncbi:MAG TPA: PIN domain-containing protein [Gemmataceae bacterium]|jgi:predicted nucleic acid-binding protein|nr:PIN domain-containing protein [Gemmataceae bacterium]
MKQTFADTFFFLALLNPRDQAHRQAHEIGHVLEGRLVTSEYVLIEVGDAMSRPLDRSRFLSLVDTLATDPEAEVVAADTRLLSEGIDLYRNRPDKDWPLTDCLSFVIMARRGITDALTGDEHFRQAGFNPLFGS